MNARKGILAFFMALALAAAIFCLRRGWERPLLGLADAFSISGFCSILWSVFPRLARSDAFDGFSYAAKSALAGWFPALMVSYPEYKKQRGEGRDGVRSLRGNSAVGGVFLAIGLLLSLFFL
jgi:hypothetical protein